MIENKNSSNEEQKIPVKCKNCERVYYVPSYCFFNGLWCGDIRRTLNFECPSCGWKEKVIV